MDRSGDPARPPTTTYNVLFVCTGNTCRSPMAEAFARHELRLRGWSNVEVRSAGVAATPGSGATGEARSVMARRGLDLGEHASAMLTPELVDWADVILTMSHSHVRTVGAIGGAEKVSLLDDFTASDAGSGVPDPYGGDEAEYEQTAAVLQALVTAALDRLSPIVQP